MYKVDGYSHNHDDGKQPKSRRPTLIAHGGFNSTLEELYTSAAAPSIEWGYNYLRFEGPGQGGVIHKQKILFKYDWEKVVTSVVDYALTYKINEMDSNRIALMGINGNEHWRIFSCKGSCPGSAYICL